MLVLRIRNFFFSQFAKSGRSKCKKCKATIEKDTLRIIVEVEPSATSAREYSLSTNYHPSCFALPKTYVQQGLSVSLFVEQELQEKDRSTGGILSEHAAEIAAAMEVASSSQSSKKRKSAASEGPLAEWKQAAEQRRKVPKKASPTAVISSDEDLTTTDPVDLYDHYHSYTIDELKDILRYNRQVLVGTKDVLLYKVIDGCRFNGRLSHCPICQTGRLKIDYTAPPEKKVKCNGTFDETSQRRIDCYYTCAPDKAPRHAPFYRRAPTPAQEALMDQHDERSNDGDASNEAIDACRQALAHIADWYVADGKDALRRTALAVVAALPSGMQAQFPDDPLRVVGPLLLAHDKAALPAVLVSQFGKTKNEKMAAVEDTADSPNAALVAAFAELSRLYFQTGNPNAGRVYQKVVGSLSSLTYAITADNCGQLGKGNNKLPNIGKSTLEKIVEFVTTGTMEKLIEKRADAA